MSDLYRLYCEHCDSGDVEDDVTFEGVVGAAVIESERCGRIVCSGAVVYFDRDEKLIEIPHPLEKETLQDLNVTWGEAVFEGRLFDVDHRMCLDCGAITGIPAIRGPFGSVLVIGIAMMIVCLIMTFWFGAAWLFVLGILFLFLPMWLSSWWWKFRFRERIAKVKKSCCDECGSARLKSLVDCRREFCTCPKCREKSLRVEWAGMS